MPTCLSLVSSRDPERLALALDNHRTYCSRFGYSHTFEDVSHVTDRELVRVHVLHLAVRALRSIPEGDLLMVISADSGVYRPLRLEELMEGLSVIMTLERPETSYEPKAQMNWLVVRNNEEARTRLNVAIFELHKLMLHDPARNETKIFTDLGAVNYYSQFAGTHLNLNWQNDKQAWFSAPIFVVNTLHPPLPGLDARWHHNPFTDPRLGRLVLEQVNHALHGRPSMQQPAYPALSEEAYTGYNPLAPIALVTLYTHHINVYARIAEHNIKRYCDRHGLAYHVYRAVPPDLDDKVSGTWHKAWLLERHFDQHQWVIWIDADILFTSQWARLTALLEERDLLLAKDIGDFEFNAGLMGFRCTEKNRSVLAHIRARIEAIEDKSTVYASGGDQKQCNIALKELGLLDGSVVLDLLSVNTPPLFRSPSTLMVHYVGLSEPYRSLYMAMDDAVSASA